ncbi:unnamed protein product, partial [Arabidopsis halleri]
LIFAFSIYSNTQQKKLSLGFSTLSKIFFTTNLTIKRKY